MPKGSQPQQTQISNLNSSSTGQSASTGQTSGTSTSSVNLSPEQQNILNLLMPAATQFGTQGPRLPDFSTVAPFNPTQEAAQTGALSAAAGPMSGLAASGAAANQNLISGDLLNASSNPALQSYIQAATRPITQQLTENVLPNIRSEAIGANQFGSSRQGIAEGLASRGASQAVGDTTARIANAAYGQGLDAYTRGLGLLPQTTALQLAPAQATGAVGDVRQALEQARLGEQAQRYWYEQMYPLYQAQELAGIFGALPYAGSTTAGTSAGTGATTMSGTGTAQGLSNAVNNNTTNPWLSALGGASMGASLGSAVPFLGTGIGALLGGGLGFLGGR